MCIIVIKESGTPVDWDMLDVCDANNPDGGGYAYNSPDGVVIRKGFFFIEDMEKALDAEPIDQTKSLIMFHFRIATHGEINEGTCHPFPMSSDVEKLTATNIVAPIAVAHNGIVPGMPRDKKLSDTMLFIRDYMAPLGRLIKKKSVQTLVEELASSKLAILTEGELPFSATSSTRMGITSVTPDIKITLQRTHPPTTQLNQLVMGLQPSVTMMSYGLKKMSVNGLHTTTLKDCTTQT